MKYFSLKLFAFIQKQKIASKYLNKSRNLLLNTQLSLLERSELINCNQLFFVTSCMHPKSFLLTFNFHTKRFYNNFSDLKLNQFA